MLRGFTLLLLPFLLPIMTETDQARQNDETEIREVIQHYLLGHATGDGAHHEVAFNPESKLMWSRDGALNTRSSAEYIAGSPGSPAEDEDQRERRIESVDVTGDAAVVKVVLDYPGAVITDYMSMLKIDGRWWIANKIFTVQPKDDAS